MEKSEKLKELAAFAEGWGLTAEEVITYFGKISVCSDKTEEVSVQSEKTKAVEGARPGMYYYSDGMISSEVIQGKQISGVVGWVDESGEHGLVLGLREAVLQWRTSDLEAARRQNKKAGAADWSVAYAFDGVRPGKAFLPSKGELVRIFRNLYAVQIALEKINMPLLAQDKWYWSSSEYYNLRLRRAWVVRPSDGGTYSYSKDGSLYRVRCVLAF